MKLVLVDPPLRSFAGIFSFYFPLGLTYVAGSVRRAGFQCSILDMDAAEEKAGTLDFSHEYEKYGRYLHSINDPDHHTWELMRRIIVEQKPDVIGISALTTKFGSVIQTARFCKEILPNVPILVGGAHASTMPELTLSIDEVDLVVRGEADETMVRLLERFAAGHPWEDIPGISFRRDGKIVHNPPAPMVQDLDSLPFPDRSALMHPDHYSSEDMGVTLTSRGCPFQCSYCFHPWEKRVRYRSTPDILEEIREVRALFNTHQFHFKDDSFTVKRSHVVELCEALLKEPFRIGWSCTTRVDLVDDELLSLMKRSGCNQISVGIESGSERILKETDKGITHAQILKAAALMNKHRIFWSGYFMIGLPTETEQDIRKTFEFLKVAKPYYAGLGVYNPFPRTKLFDQAVEMGLLDPNPDLNHFLTTNPKDLFFRDPDRRVLTMDKPSLDRLINEVMSVFHSYNTRFVNLARRGFARRRTYFNDPSLFRRDIEKVCDILGLPCPL